MPDWRAHLRPRFAQIRLTAERENEIIEELSYHLEQSYQELCASGVSDAEAERRVLEELREPDTLEEYMRVLRQAHTPAPITPGASNGSFLADILQDLRYAVRVMRRQPAFTVAAILTLALGIGANSAIFGLVDATLLRPLPFPDPERLVMVWEQRPSSPRGPAVALTVREWHARNRSFELMAGVTPSIGSMVLSGENGSTETIPRQWATAGFFEVLGVRAIAGRTFLRSDNDQGRDLVVLSEGFWRTRFDADPALIGRALRLDGLPHTVVGVVPDDFAIFGRTSMWALDRRGGFSVVVGRLKPNVTQGAASADMVAVEAALARELPHPSRGQGVLIEPLRDVIIDRDVRLTSMLFLGVVGIVLLICCANVANLLLARATVRSRELAIRSALGARRHRIVRQLLTESLLLAAIGAVLGLGLGAAILQAAPEVIPEGLLPPTIRLAFDGRVVAFCVAAAALSALAFGLAPAWQATQPPSAQLTAGDSRTTTGRGGTMRGLLVAGQVATAVLLLFGAGLLLRTLLAIEHVDRGYRATSVLTMMVDPVRSQYSAPGSLLRFYREIEQEVASLPGVRGVAWTTRLPFLPEDSGQPFFEIVGDTPVLPRERPALDFQTVSAEYFHAIDLPILTGRAFNDGDTTHGASVCIVNEAFVRRYLHGRSPIGVRLAMWDPARPDASTPAGVTEIVGVARQTKWRPDEIEDVVQMYVPMGADPSDDIYLVVRADDHAEALAPSVRAAIARVDAGQLTGVRDVVTLEDIADGATARHRFRALLAITFAGLALVLAMVGLFGILAYSVQQRVRDFGVRRALGATTGAVLRLVAGSAIRMIAAGAVVGLALSIVLGRLLTTMLFGVTPLDALTFAAVTIVVVLTSALSIAGPAWRAARIDPAVALRSE